MPHGHRGFFADVPEGRGVHGGEASGGHLQGLRHRYAVPREEQSAAQVVVVDVNIDVVDVAVDVVVVDIFLADVVVVDVFVADVVDVGNFAQKR